MWGPVELVGIIAGPVFLLFLIIIIVFLVINYHQRVYHNRQRLDMEDPSCEMCLSKDKTLQDLVYDLSTSGSGSGTSSSGPCLSLAPHLFPSKAGQCLLDYTLHLFPPSLSHQVYDSSSFGSLAYIKIR